jgi:ribA/ribD-fused uncharacterized protein
LFETSLLPIDFYHSSERYYEFTNFASAPTPYENQTYPTSEHAFQAQKYQPGSPEALAFTLSSNSSPSAAFRLGAAAYPMHATPHVSSRYGTSQEWLRNRDRFMYEVLLAKFTQNQNLQNELLDTGYRMITEWTDHPGGNPSQTIDEYWGTNRHTHQGNNHLGKLLMVVRAELRGEITPGQIDEILTALSKD